ncbi:MAG: hypothetical protein ABR964_14385 [Tepidisphaeraceae bacterium]|jgi:Tfp pilus assembly protein PilV
MKIVRRWRRRGLGLFELLVSLAISATLLTAVGAALHTATQAYQINQEQSTLTQRARLAMNRMLAEIRNTQLHAPLTASVVTQFAGGVIVNDIGINMFTNANVPVTYQYDAANQQLLMIDNNVTHVMLHGVTAFQITMQPMQSATSLKTGGPFDLLERATITLTVKTVDHSANATETTNRQSVTLSSSVMPRKNVW